ncbi:MFS transporter [Novosphingobium rosa]|uniref:MFS transporter n=1 Tax=Novosphingobium rosa TaxID=76978 RepID=UPI0008354D10|nr:MFS transporter [Novosphingobium rosa]
MIPAEATPQPRQLRFLLAFALAYAGGVLSYMPLLGFLLPERIEAMAHQGRIEALSTVLVAGAVVASLSNIAAGWLSDRSLAAGRSRRGWIGIGLVGTVLAYGWVWRAQGATELLLAVCAVQAAINVVLAPLLAMLADEVPDAQKGLAGGLTTVAQPVSMGLSAALVALEQHSEALAYLALTVLITGMVLPLLATQARLLPAAPQAEHAQQPFQQQVWLWMARFLPQTAMNVLSYYLIYYFEDVTHGMPAPALVQQVSLLSAIATTLSVPLAVVAGHWARRQSRRRLLAQIAVLAAAAGLLAMRLADGWQGAALGYGLFAVGTHVFLAMHAALLVQALPSPRHRGRDMGLQNLSNTVPSLVGPALAVSLASGGHFALLLGVLAPMVVLSALSLGLAKV